VLLESKVLLTTLKLESMWARDRELFRVRLHSGSELWPKIRDLFTDHVLKPFADTLEQTVISSQSFANRVIALSFLGLVSLERAACRTTHLRTIL